MATTITYEQQRSAHLAVPAEMARFWSLVDMSSGCWHWTGHLRDGYGAFRFEGRYVKAHRVALESTVGPIGLLMALHRCDVKACVNPAHLYAGTHADNSRDAKERGQMASGERQHLAKLTEGNVAEIRSLRAGGVSLKALASRFGVGVTSVHNVVTGKTWARTAEAHAPSPTRRGGQ